MKPESGSRRETLARHATMARRSSLLRILVRAAMTTNRISRWSFARKTATSARVSRLNRT